MIDAIIKLLVDITDVITIILGMFALLYVVSMIINERR